MDKVKPILIDALREGASAGGEQRLYRSGKLPGLFPGRTGASLEAATQALREQLIEVVRTEQKGKTTIEWVRVTPRGVEYLHSHESPVRALDELRAALAATQEGVPVWVADIRRQLEVLAARLTEEVHTVMRRLDSLSQCVAEALQRAGHGTGLPEQAASAVPWGPDVVNYLEHRKVGGVPGDCPMPELFAAVRQKHADLLVKDFHAGLRRLQDRGAVRLVPFTDNGALPEPEYALLDGSAVYYHVTR
jgi:hypothetical protein